MCALGITAITVNIASFAVAEGYVVWSVIGVTVGILCLTLGIVNIVLFKMQKER